MKKPWVDHQAHRSAVATRIRDIEREWSAELGPERFAQLKELLLRVGDSPLIR